MSFWDLVAGAGVDLIRLSRSAPNFFRADAARERDPLRTVRIPVRPWEVYWSMPADQVLAEDSRYRAIPREEIAYVCWESDLSTNTDQVVIRSSDGFLALFFELGTFVAARKALFSFLMPATGVPEQSLGVFPSRSEPQVDGCGFQYSRDLVVTDRRIILCMCEDERVDETETWLRARENETKAAGRPWREGEMAARPDAPWQRLAGTPIPELLALEMIFLSCSV